MSQCGGKRDCYCYTCDRDFHSLGIARHRAMHRDRSENCQIMYSDGMSCQHIFATPAPPEDGT